MKSWIPATLARFPHRLLIGSGGGCFVLHDLKLTPVMRFKLCYAIDSLHRSDAKTDFDPTDDIL